MAKHSWLIRRLPVMIWELVGGPEEILLPRCFTRLTCLFIKPSQCLAFADKETEPHVGATHRLSTLIQVTGLLSDSRKIGTLAHLLFAIYAFYNFHSSSAPFCQALIP